VKINTNEDFVPTLTNFEFSFLKYVFTSYKNVQTKLYRN